MNTIAADVLRRSEADPSERISAPRRSSVVVPALAARAGAFRRALSFAGPGYLVAVGYMDPGNWGTDLQAGTRYKYGLLSVVGLASLKTPKVDALSI